MSQLQRAETHRTERPERQNNAEGKEDKPPGKRQQDTSNSNDEQQHH